MKMLRFPELDLDYRIPIINTGVRITVDEALSDPVWGAEFLSVGRGAKRVHRDVDGDAGDNADGNESDIFLENSDQP